MYKFLPTFYSNFYWFIICSNPTAFIKLWKILFSNTLLISQKILEISNALCWPISTDTKSFLTLLICGVKPCRKNFPERLFAQPQKCGVRLVTVTNRPVLRPSTTSCAFSHFFCFFFPTSWKNWWLPVLLKTLKPNGYAAKYQYRKGFPVVRYRKTGMSQTQEIKTFSA